MYKISRLITLILVFLIILSNNNSKNLQVIRNNYKGQRVLNAVDYLIEKSNMEGIKSYKDGIQREMFFFNHSSNDNYNEYIDYRYIGNDANNYVYFNCNDTEDLSTCELWRIIGVFINENFDGDRQYYLKIMRNDPIENISWSDSSSSWENSTLFNYLNNGDYWYSLKGKFQNMIENTKFYDGQINNSMGLNELYFKEREHFTFAKVGLVSLSDYGFSYANGVNEGCFNNIFNCSDNYDSWMNKHNNYWSLNSDNGSNTYVINNNVFKNSLNEFNSVYPTVYLKSNVGIESGNGSEGDAYVLRLLKKSSYLTEAEMLDSIDDAGIKKEVYVDDTLSVVSILSIVFSSGIIIVGLLIIIYNFIKSKRELK